MHELGLCAAVVDAVRDRAGDRPVTRVRVRIGALHRVNPDAFAMSFALAAAGTVAAAAATDVVEMPVTTRCATCGAEEVGQSLPPGCRHCGADVELTGGDELVLESIEYAAAPAAG